MCGICGIVSLSGTNPPSQSEIQAMMRVLSHRGPDGEGTFVEGPAALGHRRLSIIDVAGGRQPMGNEDENLQITFNGEIYNHGELRPRLEHRGHRYRTQCDTETILHLFEVEGEACVKKLRGMFAFAVWDRRKQSLFCARDRLGVKPFYYTAGGGRFAFASEIKALLELPHVSRRINRNALPEFFTLGYISSEETLFEGIYKLMPGHVLWVERGRWWTVPYWSVRFPSVAERRPLEEYVEEFRELFTESVRLRLMSDVPLGAFLSGGLDSTAVVATMRKLTAGGRVKTFSVGYAEDKYNELSYAHEAAQQFETDHHEVRLDCPSFFAALPRMIWHEDEPVAWPSSISLFLVAQEAAKHVKVVLTGEGSDELMGGYRRYWATLLNTRLGGVYWALSPQKLQEGVQKLLEGGIVPPGLRWKLQHTFLNWPPGLDGLYFSNFNSTFLPDELPALLSRDGQPGLNGMAPYRTVLELASSETTPDLLSKLLYIDIRTYLVELLMKQDQMSMAASVESRVPFLDQVLVERVCAMPSAAKLHRFNTKYVLRKAMGGIVPRSILRRRKRGFPTPLPPWMRQQHGAIRAILLNPRLSARGVVRAEAVQSLVAAHERDDRRAVFRLWRLLNFELWCRIFFDRDGSENEITELPRASA